MTPIATIIHNQLNNSRMVNWTAEKQTWLEANGTAEVPYEVWSAANKVQRESIKAEVTSGYVTLELRVMKPNGCQEIIPFSPVGDLNVAPVQTTQVIQAKVGEAQKKEETQEKNYKVLGNRVVVANSKGMDELSGKFGMKSQIVDQPGVVEVGEDLKDIVKMSNGIIEDRGGRGFNKKADEEKAEEPVSEAAEEPVEEPAEEPAEEEVEEKTEEAVEEEVNELLSAKKYEEALEVLTDWFGEDQVTFKAAALRYTKTFEAVVKKFKLSKKD